MSKFPKGQRRVKEAVTYQKAVRRVTSALKADPKCDTLSTSQLADAIWPDHGMTAQAATLAAGPFMRRMAADGLIVNVPDHYRTLWKLNRWGLDAGMTQDSEE